MIFEVHAFSRIQRVSAILPRISELKAISD